MDQKKIIFFNKKLSKFIKLQQSDDENELQQLFQQADNYNHISIYCQLNNYEKSQSFVQLLFQNLSSLNKMSQLSLNIIEANYLNYYGISSINEKLSKMKNITHLELSLLFDNKYFNNERKFIQIFQGFEFMNHLKCLSLTIQEYSDLQNDGFIQLSNSLLHLVNLKEFSLKVGNGNDFSFNRIQSLLQSIVKLEKLVNIKIHIPFTFYINSIILQLILKIQNLNNMKDLDLKFVNQNELFEITYSQNENKNNDSNKRNRLTFYTEKKQYLLGSELKDFIVNCKNIEIFKSNNIPFNHQFLNEITHFQKTIKELSIYLPNLDCTQFEKIFSNISKLCQLDKLVIYFQFYQQNVSKYIKMCFEKLKLKSLKVNFNFNNKQRENFDQFSIIEPLPKLNKTLIRLDLSIFVQNEYTLFKELAKSFQKLNNLRVLSLRQNTFESNIVLNKIQGNDLLLAILNLVNLNQLTLDFNISDLKLLYPLYFNNLKKLDKLRRINLIKVFPRCYIKNYHLEFMKKYLRLVDIV